MLLEELGTYWRLSGVWQMDTNCTIRGNTTTVWSEANGRRRRLLDARRFNRANSQVHELHAQLLDVAAKRKKSGLSSQVFMTELFAEYVKLAPHLYAAVWSEPNAALVAAS